MSEQCLWVRESDGQWGTECGGAWSFRKGGPTENEMTYCFQCGKRIEASGDRTGKLPRILVLAVPDHYDPVMVEKLMDRVMPYSSPRFLDLDAMKKPHCEAPTHEGNIAVLGYNKAHLGVDYAAPRGTPVRAMAGGTVTFAGRKGASGKLVVVRHGRGLESSYAHLDGYGPGIKRGVRVKQKQVIGRVGATGRATGPHLHFAVKNGGRFVNPQKLKLSRMDPVKQAHKPAFQALIARRVDQLSGIGVPGHESPQLAASEAVPLADIGAAAFPNGS